MKKILLVIGRECRLRLRRPGFWVITLLVPLLLAALYALPVAVANRSTKQAQVLVVDETGVFEHSLRPTAEVAFLVMPDMEYARRQMNDDNAIDAILFIPMRETTIPHDAFLYHRSSTPPLGMQQYIGGQLQMILRNAILEDVYQLDPQVFHSVSSANIRLHTQDAATGRESFARVKSVVAIALSVLMVLALIVFGVQVMRSIQEEKATRVAEIVASAVHPVQLMVGKVAGVAATAIVQLVLWVMLTTVAIGGIQAANSDLFAQAQEQQMAHSLATKGPDATVLYNTTVQLVDETVQGLTAINLPLVAGIFFLFFLLGYLFYGALLAALAARLDSDADALQWVLVILSPLLLTLMLSPLLLHAPSGIMSQWLGVIPFTAPSAVLLRLPFGVSVWQVVLAVFLLLAFFLAAAWMAARSYRHHLIR